MKLKFLSLYPNMMDLYGDSGNLQILSYRAAKRGVKITIDSHQVGDSAPDFCAYDLLFLGGGSDKEQKVIARDIIQYRSAIQAALDSGVFLLTICGGFQLFGESYRDAEGNLIKGLGLFPYTTEASTDKRERCIGNIVLEVKIAGRTLQIVGFENHGGQTLGVEQPFGRVLYGNGNAFQDTSDGIMRANVIGTYLHGPLLAKNPELADYILATCLHRKYHKNIPLTPLDDTFEICARQEMLAKLGIKS